MNPHIEALDVGTNVFVLTDTHQLEDPRRVLHSFRLFLARWQGAQRISSRYSGDMHIGSEYIAVHLIHVCTPMCVDKWVPPYGCVQINMYI